MSAIEERLRGLAADYRAQTVVEPELLDRVRHSADRRAKRRSAGRAVLAVACLAVLVVSLTAIATRRDHAEDPGVADDLAPASSALAGGELVVLVCDQLSADLEGTGPVFQTLAAYERAATAWQRAIDRSRALATTAVVDAASASIRDEIVGVLTDLRSLADDVAQAVDDGDVAAADRAADVLERRAAALLPEATGMDVDCGRFG